MEELEVIREGRYLRLKHARLIYRNFSGVESKYNAKGSMNFSIILPDPLAEELLNEGWRVKLRTPLQGDPFYHMPVVVSYDRKPPEAYLMSTSSVVKLSKDTIALLDDVEVEDADVMVAPSSNMKPYLRKIVIKQVEYSFDRDYADILMNHDGDDEEVNPFD